MASSTSDIKNGFCLSFNNDIYKVIDFQHVKPGKGPAFIRTKLKSCTTGKVVDNTFSSGHKIEEVRVESRKFQFLYRDTEGFHFMDVDNFNQIQIQDNLIEYPQFLKESENVFISINAQDNNPLSVDLPINVVLEVTHTEPGIKGNTATNTTKAATLETGAEIQVPLFINIGDFIKVDTTKGNYLERVKNN